MTFEIHAYLSARSPKHGCLFAILGILTGKVLRALYRAVCALVHGHLVKFVSLGVVRERPW